MTPFPSLRDVYLQQNAFSGKIPSDFSSSLRRLDVSSNILTGTVPFQLFQLPMLELFGASLNCLSEELPDLICQATQLKQLYVDGLGSARYYIVVIHAERL